MTPLVFLPGWCVGRGPLNAAVNAQNGLIFDLPGYGSAPLITDFYAAADDIAARLQPGSTLIGWSLGAQLAIAIAARAPQKVGKLVLIAGTTSFVQRNGWPHAMAPEMLADFATGVAADIEAMLPRFVGGFNRGDARAKAVTSELLELADARPSGDVLATGLIWLRDVDLRPLAPQIKAPTMLVFAADQRAHTEDEKRGHRANTSLAAWQLEAVIGWRASIHCHAAIGMRSHRGRHRG